MNRWNTTLVEKKLGFICEKCFSHYIIPIEYYVPNELLKDRNIEESPIDIESYQSMVLKCPNCKSDKRSWMFEVDQHMAPIISVLNKLGYRTKYSCQGHCYGINDKGECSISSAYIFFDRGSKHISKKLFKVLNEFGWYKVSESTGNKIINKYNGRKIRTDQNSNFIFNSDNYIVFYFDHERFILDRLESYMMIMNYTEDRLDYNAQKVNYINRRFEYYCNLLYNQLLYGFRDCKKIKDLEYMED